MNRHRNKLKYSKAPSDYEYFFRRSFSYWSQNDKELEGKGWWYQGELDKNNMRDGRGILLMEGKSIFIS